MRNRTFADLDRVVALGGGHGLGRVMSSLSSLGSRLTGIVTTTATILSVYDILNAKYLVVDKDALAKIEEVYA